MKGYRREVRDADRWYGRLKVNVWRRLADRRIDQIDRDVLSRLLLDIHGRAPGTSDKIAQALSRVFRFALGRGYVEANPLEAARAALPRDFGSRAKKAHPMVPIADLPDFSAALVEASQGRGELCALALRLVALTAARSGEVRLATWAEVEGRLWRIPAERTKTGQPHIVPLTEEALAVLGRARELTGGEGLIFPGSRNRQPLSDMTLSKRMKALAFKDADGRDAVPHGLRAGFKTWCQDHTEVDPALAERALGHARAGRRAEGVRPRNDGREAPPADGPVGRVPDWRRERAGRPSGRPPRLKSRLRGATIARRGPRLGTAPRMGPAQHRQGASGSSLRRRGVAERGPPVQLPRAS